MDGRGDVIAAWHRGLWITLRVFAYLGLAFAVLTLFGALVDRGSTMGYGSGDVRDPLLAIVLGVVSAALLTVGIFASRRWAAGLALLVGVIGTVLAVVGLVQGGAAGPEPAALWFVLVGLGGGVRFTSSRLPSAA